MHQKPRCAAWMCDMWYRQALPHEIAIAITTVEFRSQDWKAIAALEFRTDNFSHGSTLAHVVSLVHLSKRGPANVARAAAIYCKFIRDLQEKQLPVRKLGKIRAHPGCGEHQVIGVFWWRTVKVSRKNNHHTSSSITWSSSSSSSSSCSLATVSSAGAVSAGVGPGGLTRLLARAAWTIVSWDVDKLLIEH